MMRVSKQVRTLATMIVLVGGMQIFGMILAGGRSPLPPTRLNAPPPFAIRQAPTLGSRSADVVIYLFSDYSCSNCRVMHADLRRLVASDGKIRIVYRDWPVLGERSRRAARLAIASVAQGRHAQFDDELMRRGGSLDEPALRAAAQRADVDWPRLERALIDKGKAIDDLLDDTDRQARALQFVGTPVLLIGPFLSTGRIDADRLRELVRQARA